MDFWQRYRAIDARDSRFDGQFFTAVRSTGIYCRPSCPARTPKAGNVVFYETSAAAHEAGYRACKRCLPEAVPGTPAWNVRSDVAGRAMRLIGDGVVDREGVAGLASRLGYSARQLNRIVGQELGAGPLALARASRAQTARTLLVSTDMLLADVAFAAGFRSVRQFNDTIAEIFALTPTALRAASRHRAGSTARRRPPSPDAGTARMGAVHAATELTFFLPYRPPFDPGIFAFLAARAIPGIEDAGPSHYARTLRLRRGDAAMWVRHDAGAPSPQLSVSLRMTDLQDLQPLLSRVRRLFDLDADPVAIDQALGSDLRLAGSVLETPGLRVPGSVDPHELLVRAMIGQQITVKAARTALTQLSAAGSPAGAAGSEAAGSEAAGLEAAGAEDSAEVHGIAPRPGRGTASRLAPGAGLDRLFPTAAQIAASGPELLRGPRRRTESVLAAARAMASGELDFGYGDDPASLDAKLLPLAGIGPWTVGYVAMRVLGAPDIFLAGDAAVRNGLKRLPTGGGFSPVFGEASPWRSYATMHLWRAAASGNG